MSRLTSFNELYNTIGAIILESTGRAWWRQGGKQVQSINPHALIFFSAANGIEKQVVETIEIEPGVFKEYVWNACMVECLIEFKSSRSNDTAQEAAGRFRSALYQNKREYDLNIIAGLSGRVDITDISAMFREDIQPRVDVRFNLAVNLADPQQLGDDDLSWIENQEIRIGATRATLTANGVWNVVINKGLA